MIENFQVVRRNNGHWDIITKQGRAFRIRGGPGLYCAMDGREPPYPVSHFKTVTACMTFICEILMHEELQLAGSSTVIVSRLGNPVVPPNAEAQQPPRSAAADLLGDQ